MSGDETGRSPDIPALLVGSEDSRALIWWMQHRPIMASLVALQDSSGQVQQLQHGKGKDKQQKQSKQQQGKCKGSSTDSEKQTRVDLFVPGRSQAWLTDNIVKAGINPQSVFEQIVREPRVVAALQQAATARP
jgi:hypothetical protein